jgi:hypothetical protein
VAKVKKKSEELLIPILKSAMPTREMPLSTYLIRSLLLVTDRESRKDTVLAKILMKDLCVCEGYIDLKDTRTWKLLAGASELFQVPLEVQTTADDVVIWTSVVPWLFLNS